MSLSSAALTCYCTHIALPLPSFSNHSSFPLPTTLCHCTICRRSTGGPGAALFALDSGPDSATLAKCTAYASSSGMQRYFCSRCGSHLFARWGQEGDEERRAKWFAWIGVVERGDSAVQDTMSITAQVFVSDAVDGGLLGRMVQVAKQRGTIGRDMHGMLDHVWLSAPGERATSFDEMDAFLTKARTNAVEVSDPTEMLRVECHCGGVRFCITRPSRSKQYSEKVQYYLKQDNTKYLARFCTCRSCRSALGHPLQPWTYVPPENIVTTDGAAIEFGDGEDSLSQLSGVRKYKSQEDTTRSFCGTCGATVFYECTDREWVVDISTGLLRSETGSWAEDWLEWNFDEVSWNEECRDKTLLEAVTGKVF